MQIACRGFLRYERSRYLKILANNQGHRDNLLVLVSPLCRKSRKQMLSAVADGTFRTLHCNSCT